MFKLLKICFFSFLFILFSCQIDNLEVDDWSPEIVAPLINAHLTIADLIPETGSTQYDDDGFIKTLLEFSTQFALLLKRAPQSLTPHVIVGPCPM